MPDSAAIDVAIGLVFVYFVLSLVCSVANETLASALGWRAKVLREGLMNILTDPDKVEHAEEAVTTLFKSPLIAPMIRPAPRRPAWVPLKSRERYPSYIPSRTFVAATLGAARELATKTHGADATLTQVIEHLPPGRTRDAFRLLHQRAGEKVEDFERAAEEWYDDQMERVSGWYKRRVHLFIWIWALAIAIALNADTIRIGRTLWTDKAVRDAVAAQAQNRVAAGGETSSVNKVARDVGKLDQIKVPMGWTHKNSPHSFWEAVSKLIGLLLTAAALSLGAPFWFDLLSKVSRLRASGAPPPASGAVRSGEGEQKRGGAGATVT